MNISENTNWLIWRDGIRTPYENMAVDELLLEESAKLNKVILRFYAWDRPSCSFGYSQSPTAVPRTGYTLVRRPTGGGIVFHDVDLTYTLAIPHEHPICRLDRMQSYLTVHQAVIEGLKKLGTKTGLAPETVEKHDRATLQCFVSPSPHDILTEDGSAKLAGAAQRRTRLGILHQGSIALAAAHGRGVQALVEAVADGLQKKFEIKYTVWEPEKEFFPIAAELAQRKYASREWNEEKISPEQQK